MFVEVAGRDRFQYASDRQQSRMIFATFAAYDWNRDDREFFLADFLDDLIHQRITRHKCPAFRFARRFSPDSSENLLDPQFRPDISQVCEMRARTMVKPFSNFRH